MSPGTYFGKMEVSNRSTEGFSMKASRSGLIPLFGALVLGWTLSGCGSADRAMREESPGANGKATATATSAVAGRWRDAAASPDAAGDGREPIRRDDGPGDAPDSGAVRRHFDGVRVDGAQGDGAAAAGRARTPDGDPEVAGQNGAGRGGAAGTGGSSVLSAQRSSTARVATRRRRGWQRRPPPPPRRWDWPRRRASRPRRLPR